jgi:low temperature requirement protein LtrA
MVDRNNHLHTLLRQRDGHHARVTWEELFFDLVYVFAVTQLSHTLLHDLSASGMLHTLILWFAVWLGWQYTCWVTNWFSPETPPIRALLFMVMAAALIMAAALPEAFGDKAGYFVVAYVIIQVGRTAWIVFLLGQQHALTANYRRMLVWLLISAALWCAGARSSDGLRTALWALAVLCEYLSPMSGFAFPGMGRSSTQDWTIEGGHLTERCQLFVIVALGETLLATGGSLASSHEWTFPVLSAMTATFLSAMAVWWLYFGTSGEQATQAITHSADPGRMGAMFHYVHVILVGGIIVMAVGNDLTQEDPEHSVTLLHGAVICAGSIIFLIGSAIYKRVVYGTLPLTHILGALVLCLSVGIIEQLTLEQAGWLTTIIMLITAFAESRVHRHRMMKMKGRS